MDAPERARVSSRVSARVSSLEEMERAASQLADALMCGDCVLLFGEMGVGKSVFARAAARRLGVTAAMPSPTFTVMQVYEVGACAKSVVHMDLYRLHSADEAFAAGVVDALRSGAVCFVEWPDGFPALFDGLRTYEVRISYNDDDGQASRIVEIIWPAAVGG